MKKSMFNKMFGYVLVTVMILGLLSGCGTVEDGESLNDILGYSSAAVCNTVYIIDNTKYSPDYVLEDLLYDGLDACFTEKNSSATVVQLDGNPQKTKTVKYDGYDVLNSKNTNNRTKGKQIQEIIDSMNGDTVPNDSEINIVTALNIAADELSTYSDDTIKKLVIVFSGLSTLAPLDMTEGFANIDVASVVDELKQNNELPDLTGVSIETYGLGKVASGLGQDDLSGNDKTVLEELYKNIFIAAGVVAEDIVIHSDNPTGVIDAEYRQSLPEVSIVNTSDTENTFKAIRVEGGEIPSSFDLSQDVLEFPEESSLSYKPGSAEFLADDSTIDLVLEPIVNWMNQYPDRSIAIFSGTASCGTEEELTNLSSERAAAVENRLTSAGISEDRIETYALGYSKNPHKHIDTIDGQFIEEEAKFNRVTYITATDSPGAEVFYSELGL